jgi:hypothetical protein
MAEERPESRRVPIEWRIPERLISQYATNFVVQRSEHEFIIFFFELRPPLVLGSPEEQMAALEKIPSVPAECIARIVVAAERLPEFVKVLQAQLEQFPSSKRKPE